MDSHVWLRLGKSLPEEGADQLPELFPGVRFATEVTPEDHASIDVVFTSSRLDDETTAMLPSLKWIHTTYGGGLSFLTPEVVSRKIIVTCSRGAQAEPLSEFAEACVLAFAKQLPLLWQLTQERRWKGDTTLDGLPGKIVGILGLGAVGSAVAKRLHKHGMKIRAIRRSTDEAPPYVENVFGLDRLSDILREADFLIISLPQLEGIRGLIGEAELRSMKKTSYLINLVTRGIVTDAVLAKALRRNWIAGAACNVFEANPLPEQSDLWESPNLIISPGIGQSDPLRWRKLQKFFTDNMERYLKSEPMINLVEGKDTS